ncbi:MAG: LptF/LptG family permease [Planctomycetes bacterium]|nr:LptF/LptG family permease [Planctomycetota bacterium]
MFTIHDRQMIIGYVKAYLFCLVALMGLFVVVDLFMNLEDFTSNRRDFTAVLQYVGVYYGFKSFQIFDRLCEAVVLLAGMFTVAWMQRNNELLPLLSAGVSTRRAVAPVLCCAFAMMTLAAVNQELAMPNIDAFMLENRQNPDGAKDTDIKGGVYDRNNILVSGKAAIKKELLVKDFVAVIPTSIGRNSITFLQAEEARYVPEQAGDKRTGGWLLKNAKPAELPNWPQDKEDILKPLGDGAYFLKTPDVDLDTVMRVKNWYMYRPTVQLLTELDKPYHSQAQQATLAVVFHMRLTRPIVGVILVLLGLSVILRDQNRNIFISAGLCLMLCVVFFASILACQYLGTNLETRAYVSPAMAAWLPVIIFGPISLVMFDAVHT